MNQTTSNQTTSELPNMTGRVVGLPMTGWCVRALLNAVPDVWPAEALDPGLPMKWQTRRCLKPQPEFHDNIGCDCVEPRSPDRHWVYAGWTSPPAHLPPPALLGHGAPYRPGDVVYIREGLRRGSHGHALAYYRADDAVVYHPRESLCGLAWRWQNGYLPSIFMPRDAARLWALVVRVRPPERAQSITYADVLAEGVADALPPDVGDPNVADRLGRRLFRGVWEPINGKRPGCSWPENPWEWPIEIMRLTGPPEMEGRT